MSKPQVIAISGASGAGKTTVVRLLAQELGCPYLLFDDHITEKSYPKNMKHWYQNGAEFSLIKTPQLIVALNNLLNNTDRPYIFIEEPFGRERNDLSPLIDMVVLLNQPLALCLSRVIRRHEKHINSGSPQLIFNYLRRYDEYFHDIYKFQVERIKSNCDLSINNNPTINESVAEIKSWLSLNIL